MMGAILICGGVKTDRLKKAWELLSPHGFIISELYPDLLIIKREDDKKSIGILAAKEVKKFLRERPYEKKVKAIVIEDAQSLTDDAQGSLLKVLEEPPAFALIILLCDKEGSLLPTVLSRCQKVPVLKDRMITNRLDDTYDLSRLEIGELFDLAKELAAKDKDEVIDFLENVLRFDIHRVCRRESVIEMERVIKELKVANVAMKFALEYIFLLHKKGSFS